MNLNGLDYPYDTDLVWVGLDKDGFVGAFVTAGLGGIPIEAISSQLICLNEIEKEVLKLELISTAELKFSLPRPDDYIEMANRGLYVYDWSDIHKTAHEEKRAYERIATPDNPLKVEQLYDDRLICYLKKIQLKSVQFNLSEYIEVEKDLSCLNGF